MTYLHFVTINTGQVDRIVATAPTEEDDLAATDLVEALDKGVSAVRRHLGYRLKVSTVQAALLCTIMRDDGLALSTFGVAARSRGAAKLWEILHETSAGATDPSAPPPTPWCAVRVEPTLMLDRSWPAAWLARYEVQVASAWIDRRHRALDT